MDEPPQEHTGKCTSVVKRARASKWPAIPMDEALSLIRTMANEFPPEPKCVPVAALQPVLAERIVASENVPLVRTSIKDGYAVIASDGSSSRIVRGFSAAGTPFTGILQSGECVRISTGAVVPAGANAVVQVEDTTLETDDGVSELVVNILKAPKLAQDIREPGSDVKVGDILLDVGCELGSAEIGILNTFGIQHVEIYRKPRVCVMSTGNELVEPYHSPLLPGNIRDSNRPQLMALFRSQGFKAIDAGIASDEIETLEYALNVASQFASIVVTSGGVSMGEKDFLKDVLQHRLNFEIVFGRVWMKPGLPCTVARGQIGGQKLVVFALPGNPVSSWVCANLFATPLLRHMAGYKRIYATHIRVRVSGDVPLGPRPEYCRAWIEGRTEEDLPVATVTGSQMSSRLMSVVGAQLLLILPANDGALVEGAQTATKKAKLEKISAGEIVDALVVGNI